VLRTTENMLLLVPGPLRRGGPPRSAWPRSLGSEGSPTGRPLRPDHRVLLATARVAGETAPRIHRAVQPVFSLDLTKRCQLR